MATVTKGRTFVSGETVTPAKLNELVDNAPVTSIAVADLATATTERLLPAGAVMPFAMNSAPSGWLAADGTAVSRTTYATLFAAISTTHGSGDGSTTFNLPDLRGYFIRGAGTNGDGVAAGTFAAKQAAAMLNHTHSGTTGNESTTHTHTQTGYVSSYFNFQVGAGDVGIGTPIEGPYPTSGQSTNHTHTFTSGNPSAGGGTETRPANIALLYCVKF